MIIPILQRDRLRNKEGNPSMAGLAASQQQVSRVTLGCPYPQGPAEASGAQGTGSWAVRH